MFLIIKIAKVNILIVVMIMKDKINVELVKSILIPLVGGIIVGLLTMNSMDYYKTLNTPSFAPPGFLFPIVWTILYILMGISYYLINSTNSFNKDKAKVLYIVQLIFNFLWPIIFFILKLNSFAFAWIVVLTLLVILMIIEFFKICKKAAYLQLPYLLWLIYASVLNFTIMILN